MFFTLFIFPIFWGLFNIYQMTFMVIRQMLSPSSGNTVIKSKLISRRMFFLLLQKLLFFLELLED